MVPGNKHNLHVFRNLRDQPGRRPVLFVNVNNRQVDLLARIDSYTVNKVPADNYVLDPVRYLSLVRHTPVPFQPGENPAERVLQEHLAPNMDIDRKSVV